MNKIDVVVNAKQRRELWGWEAGSARAFRLFPAPVLGELRVSGSGAASAAHHDGRAARGSEERHWGPGES